MVKNQQIYKFSIPIVFVLFSQFSGQVNAQTTYNGSAACCGTPIIATDPNGIAIGRTGALGTTSNGVNSVAIGAGTTVTGNNSTAVGTNNIVNGASSVGIGAMAAANGSNMFNPYDSHDTQIGVGIARILCWCI